MFFVHLVEVCFCYFFTRVTVFAMRDPHSAIADVIVLFFPVDPSHSPVVSLHVNLDILLRRCLLPAGLPEALHWFRFGG